MCQREKCERRIDWRTRSVLAINLLDLGILNGN